MTTSKITVTIVETRAKSYKVQAEDGFTFWVQRRKNPATEGQIEITAAALLKARDERADFVMAKKVDRVRSATLLTLPAADWESDTCLGFDFHDCYFGPGRDRQRLRVFISRAKAEAGVTIGFVEWAIEKAIEKARATDVVLGGGRLDDALRAA